MEPLNLSNVNILSDLNIAILSPFTQPEKETDLVIFANNRPYVPFYDVRQMLSKCASYAVKNNVYVVPEKFSLEDSLCLTILNPKGEPLGIQRSCHLSMSDRGIFKRDDSIDPIATPFGKIALLPSVDMNIPYVRTEAVLKGAEFFIASLYMESYDFSPQRASLYALNVAQTTGIPVAAAIGNGGIIVNGDWTLVSPFDMNEVYGKVSPSQWRVDHLAVKKGMELLRKYKNLFSEEKTSFKEEN